ncbi:MAG: hypothetical protein MJE77_11980 [Proteobacteria bacterium]|nr:hypothetical protein [Pseudomonadota bacterium]
MALSPSSGEWRPQWAFQGAPHAAIVFTTATNPKQSAWEAHGKESSLLAAEFLEQVLQDRSEADLGSDASFLYILVSREPSAEEPPTIEDGGALSEFGFGESPAAPDEWESIQLRDLIRAAIAWLREGDS